MFVAGKYDVIVIGAGHAGCEAALAAARLGCKTLITTINLDNIAMMPCNPAIGGPAKSHLVREIDALGGEMAKNTDKTCIQMRLLNTGKGPAVYALRAQADKKLYHLKMAETIENQENLDLKQILVEKIIFEDLKVTGIEGEFLEVYKCKTIILASGTYLRGKIIMGEIVYQGGPAGQRASEKLSQCLKAAGVHLMRFKTGTPARVDKRTVNFEKMAVQPGDAEMQSFSFISENLNKDQIPCWLTYTTKETHEIIRKNLDKSPLYKGIIEGTGPRYCPSIEDKVVRFADKEKHQVFVEPEGVSNNEMYVQGISTSLPLDVQIKFLRTIRGLENVEIMRPGYAIEYDCIDSTQLTAALEFKNFPGFFSAGQANGTSGYEEAAAQGLIAGINAALLVKGKPAFKLKRSEAYIGVLIDDLVTKGTNEPYRMMTSRAEYRLLLRQDNADLRLTELGYNIGLVSKSRYRKFQEKRNKICNTIDLLKKYQLKPNNETQEKLKIINTPEIRSGTTLYELLRRTEVNYLALQKLFDLPELQNDVRLQIEVAIKYEGYISKQAEQVARAAKLETKKIPNSIDYELVKGLSKEAIQKLSKIQPASLGQAARVSGVSPADISILMIYLEQQRRKGGSL